MNSLYSFTSVGMKHFCTDLLSSLNVFYRGSEDVHLENKDIREQRKTKKVSLWVSKINIRDLGLQYVICLINSLKDYFIEDRSRENIS